MLGYRLVARAIRAIVMLRVMGLPGSGILAMAVLLPISMPLSLTLAVALALDVLMPVVLSVRADHAIVVLGMLIEILGSDPIARSRRIARHRQVFLEHLISIAANSHIRTAAVERLRTGRHMRFTAVVAATLTLHVLTGSHDT